MGVEYLRAPIFEVIIGVGYKEPKIPLDTVLANALLSDKFPIIEVSQPLKINKLEGFQLQTLQTPNSGQILAKRRSADNKWLVQIQADLLVLNWIRPDDEPVTAGHYIGFTAVKKEFFSVLSTLGDHLGLNLLDDADFCHLAYLDRFPWQSGEISELSQINQAMNISTPPKFTEEGYNNICSQYTFHDASIQGFGVIKINTLTSFDRSQLIQIDSTLQGNPADGLEPWLDRAHEKQLDIFEKTFKEGIKKTWK